ncbi:MAG: nucleotidyl transferase AbiEii/AbiGii toxin family protein [bacterium]
MFEKVISPLTRKMLKDNPDIGKGFYLAGGTGLALQVGHRKSFDLDFFTNKEFYPDSIVDSIKPDKILYAEKNTLHLIKSSTKLTFLYYGERLVLPLLDWNTLKIADYRDIASEKIKTISQRGLKKDFYDVYAAIKEGLTIKDLCKLFKKKFNKSGMNNYHIIRSIVYFSDAENNSDVKLLKTGVEWKWERVKSFFKLNYIEFEKHLK